MGAPVVVVVLLRSRRGAFADDAVRAALARAIWLSAIERDGRAAPCSSTSILRSTGELVCLLGPNGIGKSTLLRTIAGMQPPLWGSVELDGVDLRAISHVELARTSWRRADGTRRGRSADRAPDRRARTVSAFGLVRRPHRSRSRRSSSGQSTRSASRHLAERDFSRLSDGERQRVMIARALAQEPVLLVLDEPTAFLDVPSRVELMGLLRQLTRDASARGRRLHPRSRAGAADGGHRSGWCCRAAR